MGTRANDIASLFVDGNNATVSGLVTTNIKNPSSSTNNIVLNTDGTIDSLNIDGNLSVENGVIKLPALASDPVSADSGDLYYNTTDNAVKYYNGFWSGPTSVIFEAARDAGHLTGSVVVLWNDVSINIGSHYDATTGRFTAPTNGIYEFHWGGVKNNTTGASQLNLRKNGTAIKQNFLSNGDPYSGQIFKMYLSLIATDYVDVELSVGTLYGDNSIYNTFGGRLIG